MIHNMRQVKSFTISHEILSEIESTKGSGSTSERVNGLLKRALEMERRENLEREAAQFFSADCAPERAERNAFQRATKKTLSRD